MNTLSNFTTIQLIEELRDRGCLVDVVFTDADVWTAYANVIDRIGGTEVKHKLNDSAARKILSECVGTDFAVEAINEQLDDAVERYVTTGQFSLYI